MQATNPSVISLHVVYESKIKNLNSKIKETKCCSKIRRPKFVDIKKNLNQILR